MSIPHAFTVHFPIALSFIMPVMCIAFAMMIRARKLAPHGWLVIVGLQVFVTIMGYVSLETGEIDEPEVEKILEKKLIQDHEGAAELFVGATVITLMLSIGLFFLPRELQFKMQMGVAALSLVCCFLAYRTGQLGGALVYEHGAAQAFRKMK
jgi:uncharacterized membrane protein